MAPAQSLSCNAEIRSAVETGPIVGGIDPELSHVGDLLGSAAASIRRCMIGPQTCLMHAFLGPAIS